MELWIDAHLSPSLALWINNTFADIDARSLYTLNMLDAQDEVIFMEARKRKAVIMSKDSDFIKLLDRYGPPPSIIWITSGNTSNANMRHILQQHLKTAIEMINAGERLVEIGGI